MSFVWPAAWLLILPLAAFLYWHPFRSRWVTGLRLALYLALVLALSGIVVEWPDRTGTLIVAVDRSRSMPDDAKEEAESFLRRLEASRPRDSRLGVVAFGAEPVIDKLPESPGFDGLESRIANPDGSDVSGALALALRQIPADSPGRILLISDGAWDRHGPGSRICRCRRARRSGRPAQAAPRFGARSGPSPESTRRCRPRPGSSTH